MTDSVTDQPSIADKQAHSATGFQPFFGWAVLGAGSLALLCVAWATGRHLWFYSDDWNILAGYHNGRVLEPFNGHLSLFPVVVFRAIAVGFGLDSYTPFRLVGLVCYLALGVTVHLYARARVGHIGGALIALAVLWNAAATTNVAFPFLLNFSLPMAALVWMWWFLDRANGASELSLTARNEVAASASLGVGLASSGIGLLGMAAAGIELMWTRPPLRRWLIMAPPVGLYVAWYAGFHAPVAKGEGGATQVVSYAAQMVLGGFSSLVGGSTPAGIAMCALFVALLVLGAVRWGTFDGRVAGGLGAILTFSLLTAWTRIGIIPKIPPTEARYCWTVGALILLTSVQLVRGVRFTSPLPTIAGVAMVGALVVNGFVLTSRLSDWDAQVGKAVAGVRTNLFAAEVAGKGLDPQRILPLSFIAVRGKDYIEMVQHLGSPVSSFKWQSPSGSAEQRGTADQLLVEDLNIVLQPTLTAPICQPGTEREVVSAGASVVIAAPRDGAEVRVARLSTQGVRLDGLTPGESVKLSFPDDALPAPWVVSAPGAAICSAP